MNNDIRDFMNAKIKEERDNRPPSPKVVKKDETETES